MCDVSHRVLHIGYVSDPSERTVLPSSGDVLSSRLQVYCYLIFYVIDGTGDKVLTATHLSRLQGTQALNLLTTLPVLSNVKKGSKSTEPQHSSSNLIF
jgi:hypothetical protein